MLRVAPGNTTPTQLQRRLRRGLQQMRHSTHCHHLHYYSCLLVLLLYTYFALSTNNNPPTDTANPVASSVPLIKHTFTSLSDTANSPDQLLFVQLIHRHGDRTPIHTYPPSHLWDDYPLPPGSLTSIGWAQHNAVGHAMQQRYMVNESLLTQYQYEPHSLVVRSTEVERCMQSVTALLTALYPPQLNHTARDAVDASRFTTLTPYPPVNVMPMPVDYLLQSTDKCPSYALTYAETQARSDAMIAVEYPNLEATLVNLTGLPAPHGSVAMHVSWTADNLLCEQAHNLSFNAELTAMRDTLFNLSRYVNYHRFVSPPTDARGSIGDTLLRDTMVTVLNKVRVDGLNSTALPECRDDRKAEDCWHDAYVQQKMRIYSAHDTTIVALLASLHLLSETSPYLLPNYATVLSLELRRSEGSYVMGWRIGAPVENEPGSGVWELRDSPLDAPCPNDAVVDRGAVIGLSETCPVASVLRYVLIMTDPTYDSSNTAAVSRLPTANWTSEQLTAALSLFHLNSVDDSLYAQNAAFPLLHYPPNDGCCVPPANLASLCSPYAAFDNVDDRCKMMRRLCPAVACGSGRVVDTATLDCVASDALRSSVIDALLITGSAVIAALLCAVFWMWKRMAAAGVSSGDTQAVGDAVRKGQKTVRAMVDKVAVGVKQHVKERRRRREQGGERGNAEEREKLELADAQLYEMDDGDDEGETDNGEGTSETVLFDDDDDESGGVEGVELETR